MKRRFRRVDKLRSETYFAVAGQQFGARLLFAVILACSPPSGFGQNVPPVSKQSSSAEKAATDRILREAQLELAAGRFQEALENCRRAIQLDATSVHAYYLLGTIQAQRGQQKQALLTLLEAAKLDPTDIAVHIQLGKLRFKGKDLLSAEKEFQKAIKLGDLSGKGHYGLALVMIAESRFGDALPHLSAATTADPGDVERLFTLAATQFEVNRSEQARITVQQIERLPSADAWVLYRLGNLLLERKLPAEADSAYERAIAALRQSKKYGSSDPWRPDLYFQTARLRFNHRDYWKALAYLDAMGTEYQTSKSRAAVLDMRGASLLGIGNAQSARESLARAVELNSSNREYLCHLIWAELMAGDRTAAFASLKSGEGKWPNDAELLRLRAYLNRENFPERARVPFMADWQLRGEGLVCCPCNVPCPCRSNGRPPHGHCENTGVFRITKGNYGSVQLDGLVFVSINGSSETQNAASEFIVHESVTDEQVIALERVYQSFTPLKPFAFTKLKRAVISFTNSNHSNSYEVRVPEVLLMKVARRTGIVGEPLNLSVAVDQFSNTIEYAENQVYRVWDQEGNLAWDFSGRQANFRSIRLGSSDYRSGKMLMQFADGSGTFNKKQREIIEAQDLLHRTSTRSLTTVHAQCQ